MAAAMAQGMFGDLMTQAHSVVFGAWIDGIPRAHDAGAIS